MRVAGRLACWSPLRAQLYGHNRIMCLSLCEDRRRRRRCRHSNHCAMVMWRTQRRRARALAPSANLLALLLWRDNNQHRTAHITHLTHYAFNFCNKAQDYARTPSVSAICSSRICRLLVECKTNIISSMRVQHCVLSAMCAISEWRGGGVE